jgi:hypothetical protein
MPFSVLQVQPTPNPNALKFVLDGHVTENRLSFAHPAAAGDHPLASKLFAIDGVVSLLLLDDFVTVSKAPAAKWGSITAKVKRVLAADAAPK